jgi:hypothetical protein
MIHIKALSNKIFEKHYSDHYDYAAFISILDPDNKKKV